MNSLVQLPLHDEAKQLPMPVSERFTPLRLGVVNIWQYDYQEWWLEGGNLLLRGDNKVGKTKVIELTLPFLFDAQMHPNRLDPFGQRDGRSMHWNLLEGGAFGQPQREGFALAGVRQERRGRGITLRDDRCLVACDERQPQS